MNEPSAQLEALLFVAQEAVSKEELCALLQVSDAELPSVVDHLQVALEGRGLTLLQTATHVQLVTSSAVAPFLESFMESDDVEPLTRAAAEVLALVAYRGPISRYDIELIRGVDSSRTLRYLLWRGLIFKQKGAARALLYDIQEEFLAHLGITKREELPAFEDLKNHESIQRLLSKVES